MRPIGLAVFTALWLLWSTYLPSSPVSASPRITAAAALIMDASSGGILYEKNPHLPLPMASTTKVMTGLLGIELARPSELVRVSASAASMVPSKIYLKPGELLRAEDLLQAILLSSANDASAALAENIGGSEKAFARLMTRRAWELGARNTRFENASGLPAEDHYSTAYDLALLLRYAMQRSAFADIMRRKTATIESVTGRIRHLRNHNRLLWSFPGALGGKTGFTRAAKHCYVGMAERGNRSLIVSVLGSANLWGDTRRLLEYGFESVGVGDTRLVLSSGARLWAAAPQPRPQEKAGRISSGGDSVYTVQVGAFRVKKQADILRASLRRRGYDAYVTIAGPRQARWYRVRVGEFETPGKARRIIGSLQSQLGLQGHVATAE
ncbi:MAG: D-alanyl-D-alanine carboxypeptidase [Nitrospinae bacterium]|nr:D-alanyl-D-alanine carboxypeptidase [Nitrospinota bacterium]